MREDALLRHIIERAADPAWAGAGVVVGPGDDAAVVRTPSRDLLVMTVDQVVRGRHFVAGTPVDLVARKAIARSVSDLAAMAAEYKTRFPEKAILSDFGNIQLLGGSK